MAKLEMPQGLTDKRSGSTRTTRSAATDGAATDDTIAVPAPADGETVNVRVEKAVGGHVVNVNRHDRNFRNEREETRVVTGDPTIVVETEE